MWKRLALVLVLGVSVMFIPSCAQSQKGGEGGCACPADANCQCGAESVDDCKCGG